MHGAGLTHSLFLPDWAVLFELYVFAIVIYTGILYKKLVYKKVVLSCSKSYESSVLNFRNLRKFFSVFVFQIRFICVQNVMYVMLATLQQLLNCYRVANITYMTFCTLRFIIIPSVLGAGVAPGEG